MLRNWEHGICYISQNWWSNFHKILILHPKLHKKVTKNTINLYGKKIRPTNLQDFLFTMNYINGKNLKEFKISDLTPIGWPTIEWPLFVYSLLYLANLKLNLLLYKLFKVGHSPSKKIFLICFNDSPSKMM